MATPKRYSHDRTVLLLLSTNLFVGIAASLLIAVRLLNNHANSSSYIVQFRSSLGLDAFETGTIYSLLSFLVFLLFVTTAAFVLSRRVYPLRRHLALVILALSLVLLIIGTIVGNALLGLR
ncbi:MAG: hypothetical protein JWM37_6 [Candidatus Saccharibacteria bacterium]|nr:hypothetical protein [Candidatus Saccharibacteria bacterium]